MADAPKLLGTDTLRSAYPKFNQAIDNANEALGTANTAKSTADNAKSTADTALANSESTQAQLDAVVVDGDSSPQIAQALADTPYTTLKEKHDAVDAQLAENTEQIGRKAESFLVDYANQKSGYNTNLINMIKARDKLISLKTSADKTITFNNAATQSLTFDSVAKSSEHYTTQGENIKNLKKGIYAINVSVTFAHNGTAGQYREVTLTNNISGGLAVTSGLSFASNWLTLNISKIVVLEKDSLTSVTIRVNDANAVLPARTFTNFFQMQMIADLSDEPVEPTMKTIYHVLGTGQSLSVGAEGNPALTTTTPTAYQGKTLMFNGGVRPNDVVEPLNTEWGKVTTEDALSSFVDLHESDNLYQGAIGAQGETISSAMLYSAIDLSSDDLFLVSQHGWGGKAYQDLKKGTIPYQNSIFAVEQGKKLAHAMGYNYEVIAVTVVHGEADTALGTTYATYLANLKQWITDYNMDVKPITGQYRDIKMLVSQTASASLYNQANGLISNAQWKASVEDSNIIHVTPQYIFPSATGGAHFNAQGYREMGEYFGKTLSRLMDGEKWLGVTPKKVTVTGNVMQIDFNVPVGPLVLDTTLIPQVSDNNYGFYVENISNGAVITSVAVYNSTSIQITFDIAPTFNANGGSVNYAYHVFPEQMGKIGKDGVRGCLRDSDTSKSLFDNTKNLYNWCASFNVPINYSS